MPKVIRETETLGERLRKRREVLRLSAKDVAEKVQAPLRYVQALEDDNYEVFPAKVYAQGFLKKILGVIIMEDADNFRREFNNEWEVRMFRKSQRITPLLENKGRDFYLTPRRAGMVLVGILGLLFLFFLVSRFINFVGSPGLELDEPQDLISVQGPALKIKGKVEKESQLTVNGREVTIDGYGNFDEMVEFAAGLNALEFVARDRFGKENKVVRYILVK